MAVDVARVKGEAIEGSDRRSREQRSRRRVADMRQARLVIERRLLERGATPFEAAVGARLKMAWPEKPVSLDIVRKYVAVAYDGRLP